MVLRLSSNSTWVVAKANKDNNNNKDKDSNIRNSRRKTSLLPNLRMITTTCWMSRRMPQRHRSRKHLKSRQSSITQIKIWTIQRWPKQNSRRLLMLMMFSWTLIRGESMTLVARKPFRKTLKDKVNNRISIKTISSHSSLEEINISNREKNRFQCFLTRVMSICLICQAYPVSIEEMKSGLSTSLILNLKSAKTSQRSMQLWQIRCMEFWKFQRLTVTVKKSFARNSVSTMFPK